MEQTIETIETKEKKTKRIWELDVLKTFAFFMMVFDHLSYDIGFIIRSSAEESSGIFNFCNFFYNYKTSFANYYINFFLSFGLFIFISGICSTLSRNNLKRGLKLLIVALLFSAGTIIFQQLSPQILGYKMITGIYFGILTCLSVLTLLSPLLHKIPNRIAIIVGIIVIILGVTFRFVKINTNVFYFLGLYMRNISSADYQPLMPGLGIYLLGIVVGKTLYKNKTSIFKKQPKITFCNFIAKHSLILYFAHQAILMSLCYLVVLLFL